MTLTEEELKEAEKQSQKSEVVKKLLDFYNEAQTDGLTALRISLNKKLIAISSTVEGAKESDNEDKTFERIDRIVTSLKKLPKEKTAQEEEDEDESSFLDRSANKKRKDK